MDILQLLNITGLAVSFLGAFLVFIYTPKIDYHVWLHSDEESSRLTKKAKRENNIGKLGMFLIFIGFGFQLVANLL